MFENIEEEFLSLLYDSQKEIKEANEKKMRQWLLVIDDSISDESMHRKNSPLLKIATSGRHFGISTCVML